MSMQQIKNKILFAVSAISSQGFEKMSKLKMSPEIMGYNSLASFDNRFFLEDVNENRKLVYEISIEGLTYGYDEDNMVLKGINLNIEKGKKYLIIGKSGSGKTTLLKVLLKQVTDYAGNVFIGRDNLKKIKNRDLDKMISVVSKNVFMLDDTIYNNVALHSNHDEKKVRDSMGRVGLSNKRDNLEDRGFCEPRENVYSFSDGDKQKISIARALVNNSSILVLDEAKGSGDSKIGYEIEELILNMREMTVLSVSHHLTKALIDKYDKIFVLDKGRIVEEGSFSELLLNNEYFYRLYVSNEA